MNHRERVISAVKHKDVDRMPYDFWAENTTIEKIFQFVKHRDLKKILQQLMVDVRHIEASTPKEINCGEYFQNFWGERYKYKQTQWGVIREDIPGALSCVSSFEDIKSFKWPSAGLFDYSKLKSMCEVNNDFAIMYGSADIWQRPALVRGMENALMDHILNPDWMHFLSRKFTDFYKDDYKRAFRASGERIDIFLVISDLGSQNGQLISLKMFDEFVAPYLKELTDFIHELGAFVMFHSCGRIFPFIERFIEIGIDILDPIQPVCKEMEPEYLAKKYGGRICFHGGIDTQKLLPGGTVEEIIAEVNRYKKVLSQNGGYICCPSHFFQPDIPVENIMALYNLDL
jgi:uroporphyrinogen decarboxylase